MTHARDIKPTLPAGVAPPAQKVSLVFPAYNRLEFTRQSWAALMANTDWSLVQEFHVYDDGSTDGTREFLDGEFLDRFCSRNPDRHVSHVPEAHWHDTRFRSPMAITLDWIKHSRAPLLAKLDNDTIYPPNWLNAALDVMARKPQIDMLGLEAMRQTAPASPDGTYQGANGVARYNKLPARFVSGLGIYRRAAFSNSLPADGGYFGLEEWQQATKEIQSGWIIPSLPVFLLDRMPNEPWRSLSEEYVRKGWQREWSLSLRYKPEQHAMWDWWRPIE